MLKFTFDVPDKLHEKVVAEAKKEGRSIGKQYVEILKKYYEKENE